MSMGGHCNGLYACDTRHDFLYCKRQHQKNTFKNMDKKYPISWIALAGVMLANTLFAETQTASSASLTIHNRSGYVMANAVWRNGKDCSQRMLQDAPIDINGANAPAVSVPAGRLMAVGVAIYDMGAKTPVVCDYILSFTLKPDQQYLLEYDVHDRRCYGQLFRQENGTSQLVTRTDPENLTERFPEFGWDQSEPGCAEL